MAIVFGNMSLRGGFQFTNSSTPPGPTPLSDQYFQYNTLLLDGLGANNLQNNTFLDSSTNDFTITRNGNTTQGSFTPFSHSNGYWSNSFDGTGDYLGLASTFNAAMGGGLASGLKLNTIEFWVYPTQWSSANSYQHAVYGTYQAVSANGRWFVGLTGQANNGAGKLNFTYTTGTGTQTILVATLANVPLNTWTHLAVTIDCSTASNSTIKFFVGGTLTETYTGQNLSTQTTNYTAPTIGGNFSNYVNNFAGNITNLRQIYGSLFYTSTFTPSTTPLTAVSGTILLTCQSNTFKDNSTSNITLTRNGDTTVSLFQPFALSSEYNSSTMGGSMYFDGTGDYLLTTNSLSGAGNFTIECWVYPTAAASGKALFGAPNWELYLSTFTVRFVYQFVADYNSSLVLVPDTWNHVVVERYGFVSGSAGGYKIFVNGVMYDTGSSATGGGTALPVESGFLVGGSYNNSSPRNLWAGYISNLRVVNGTAVYTSAFTPPTSPVTAISGTSLLLNGTNAGIVDSTGFNDLETISGAKISTAQSKWGGSSMLFNGTTDYATTTNTFLFGTGQFTIEAWIYPTATPSSYSAAIFSNVISGSANDEIQMALNTSRNFGILTWNTWIVQSSTVVPLNQWTHVAATFDGITYRIFINGTVAGTSTTLFNLSRRGRGTIGWGGASGVSLFGGYIQGLRVTEGKARYTGNFTPPTDY